MRVNVYAEELPKEPKIELTAETIKGTGRKYFGLRVYLESAPGLHNQPGDNDASAVTFWGSREQLQKLARRIGQCG